MNAIQIAIKAAGLDTLWLGVASVFGGMAAAAAHGNVEVLPSVLCFIFVIFGQMACNIMHRYFDEKNGYGENRADGLPKTDEAGNSILFILREAIKTYSIIALTSGLAILSIAGWWTLIVAALLAVAIVACNLGKHPFSRNPFYFIATFFIFGPIGVIGSELVQSQQESAHIFNWWDMQPAIDMSVSIGMMAVACHAAYGIRQMENDRKNNRRSFAIIFGKKASLRLIAVCTLIFGIMNVFGPIDSGLRKWYLCIPVSIISMAINFRQIFEMAKGRDRDAMKWLVFSIVFFAVGSFIILLFIGYPHNTGDL